MSLFKLIETVDKSLGEDKSKRKRTKPPKITGRIPRSKARRRK